MDSTECASCGSENLVEENIDSREMVVSKYKQFVRGCSTDQLYLLFLVLEGMSGLWPCRCRRVLSR